MVKLDKKIRKLKKKIDKLQKKLKVLEERKSALELLSKLYTVPFVNCLKSQTPFLSASIRKPLPAFHGGKTIQFFTYKAGESDGTVE